MIRSITSKLTDDLYKSIYYSLLLILSLLLPILSFQYGTSWDERMSIKYSNDVLNYFLSLGQDQTCLDKEIQVYNHLIYYGNIFGLISTIVAKALPFDVVEIRHVLCAILGFSTIVYVGKIARLFASYKLAVLAIVLMVLCPRLIGHSMNGFRDVSFMFGYISSTYYLLRFFKSLPTLGFSISLKLALSIFFACSVRIGGLIILVIFFISLVAYLLKYRLEIDQKIKTIVGAHFILISIVSYLLTVIIWPWAHQNPILGPINALLEFSNLQLIVNYQLFEGDMMANRNVPWRYLFVWIGFTSPIIILIGLLLAVIRMKALFLPYKFLNLVLFLMLVVPILGYSVSSRNLYDGWRHFLFIAPLIVIYSSFGWYELYRLKRSQLFKKIIAVCFIILAFFPIKAHINYFPNQTLYFNELIGGLNGAFGEFEADIDGNVMRSLTKEFNVIRAADPRDKIIVATNCDPLTVSHYMKDKNAAKAIKWIGFDQLYLMDWDYALYSCRTSSKQQLRSDKWPLKESIFNFEVDDIPVASILKREDRNGFNGYKLMNQGHYQDAIDPLKMALQYDKGNESYQRILGISYLKLGQLVLAQKHLSNSLQLNSENSFTFYYLAELAFVQNDYTKALALAKKAKEKRFNNYIAICLEATIYYLQNDFERAKNMLDDLLIDASINKKNLSLISNAYGKLYLNEFINSKGRCQECAKQANAYFEKAVNYDLSNPEPYLNSIELFRQLGSEEDMKQVQDLMNKYVR